VNAGVMLRRIAKVKEEFAAIVKEIEAIKEAEKARHGFVKKDMYFY